MSQSHRRPTMPASMKAKPQAGHCRWCDQDITGPDGQKVNRLRWHPACVVEYRIACFSGDQRTHVFARDHGVCARCGINADRMRRRCSWHEVMGRWQPDYRWRNRRIDTLRQVAERWRRFESRLRKAFEHRISKLSGTGWRIHDQAEGAWWQADHIRPLIEARGDMEFFRLSNLQTLCHVCHVAKGVEDNARRRKVREDQARQTDPQATLL